MRTINRVGGEAAILCVMYGRGLVRPLINGGGSFARCSHSFTSAQPQQRTGDAKELGAESAQTLRHDDVQKKARKRKITIAGC